jgi:laminin gamma 1
MCTNCVYNTTGDQCQNCLPGYWGDAITEVKCSACECFELGTTDASNLQCNLNNGQCECKKNVQGRQCDECKDGFWNIASGDGCVECKCNVLGSFNLSCSVATGQCFCRPGVVGLKCDQCAPYHYEFSDLGCKKCECDPLGSFSAKCDDFGKCQCREGVTGKKCDKCEENRFNFTAGCMQCDTCYNLVQKQVVDLRGKRVHIEKALKKDKNLNENVNSDEYNELESKLQSIKALIYDLHDTFYTDNELKSSYNDTIDYLKNEIKFLNERIEGKPN